ncbi:hypothetical protein R84B8_01071 [Treponema sp. R8-4-B8]
MKQKVAINNQFLTQKLLLSTILGFVHPHPLTACIIGPPPPPPHAISSGNKMKIKPISLQITSRPLILALSFLLFSLFIFLSSCDLFTAPKVDLFKVISDEVDWANAAKLTVTVAVPSDWGNSPQFGEGKCGDTRLGYPFNAEFTPSPGYGFRGWLAFNSNEYNQAGIIALGYEEALSGSLNGNGVDVTGGEVTNTGAYPATVTIRVNIPVTLVPFCDNRPQVIRSNPPLIPALSAFPYDQRISVWFNMAVKQDTVVMGDTVKVSAIYNSGVNNGKLFVKETGSVYITDGDISGYFEASFPENDVLMLSVKNSGGYPANDLQLLNISVEIGQGVQNLNGITMAAAQTITYLTSTSEAQKVYEAFNIQARRKNDGGGNDAVWFADGQRWNDPEIDRRFNWKVTDGYQYDTVYIRFTVTNPEGVSVLPNRFIVTEQFANYLNGLSASGSATPETYYDITPVGGYYYINHKLKTLAPGIIRMVIRPWYEDTANDGNSIREQDFDSAVNVLHFVTVVMDTDAPGGKLSDLGAAITGGLTPDAVPNAASAYTFGSTSDMTFSLNNIENLSDNGSEGGIPYTGAYNKPWTMDEWGKLEWRVCVNRISGDTFTVDSGWLSVNDELNRSLTKSVSGLIQGNDYTVEVYFRDSMGNVSVMAPWGVIRTMAGTPVSVTGLEANVNPAGDGITLNWNTPPNNPPGKPLEDNNMLGARVYVNGILQKTVSGVSATQTLDKSSFITVPKINASNVRDGQAVTGVQRYDISVVGYNAAGDAAPVTLSVWNIPDMSVSVSNPAIELSQNNFTATLNANFSGTLVLTSDVNVSDWVPLGAFTGKFYGNGHTVSINGFAAAGSGNANIGLFGEVSGGFIRDLAVRYSGSGDVTSFDVSRSGETRFGGIAGIMSGTARLENTLVLGSFSVTVVTDDNMEVGGFAGRMRDSSSIENAYGGLDLTVNHPTNRNDMKGSSVYMGGIAGVITGDGRNKGVMVNVDKVTVVGNIDVTASACYTDELYEYEGLVTGGLAGIVFDAVIKDSAYRQGNITVNLLSGSFYIGGAFGIIGFLEDALSVYSNGFLGLLIDSQLYAAITNCSASPRTFDVIIPSEVRLLFIGGFVGQFNESDVYNCYSDSPLTVNSSRTPFYIGGFAGYIMKSSITYCYSKSDINAIRGNYVGGFAGWTLNSNIKYCYASGNIKGIACYSVGGLIGASEGSNIENCYSLGNVSAYATMSGGLTGELYLSNEYKNNFSMCEITSNSNTGGLFGVAYDGASLQYNIALGASITATSSSTINIGRVCGNLDGTSIYLSNNYANGDMTLSTRTVSGAAWTTVTPSAGTDSKDGISASEVSLRNPTYWKNTLHFLDEDWIFTTTVGMNHPILRLGKNGPEMGGQR